MSYLVRHVIGKPTNTSETGCRTPVASVYGFETLAHDPHRRLLVQKQLLLYILRLISIIINQTSRFVFFLYDIWLKFVIYLVTIFSVLFLIPSFPPQSNIRTSWKFSRSALLPVLHYISQSNHSLSMLSQTKSFLVKQNSLPHPTYLFCLPTLFSHVELVVTYLTHNPNLTSDQ